jgi:hypothetical protein
MDLGGIGYGGGNSIGLAQDRDKGRAFLNTIINLRVRQKLGTYLVAS